MNDVPLDPTCEVWACLVIPWAATKREGNVFSAIAGTHFGDVAIWSDVTFYTLNAGQGGEGVNPHAFAGSVEAYGDDCPNWLQDAGFLDANAPRPMSQVYVKTVLPDWTGLFCVDDKLKATRNEHRFDDLYDCVLHSVNEAMSLATLGTGKIAGPVTHGDLVGDGIIRLNPRLSNEPFYVRMPAFPSLGSINAEREGQQVADGMEFETVQGEANGAMAKRRLFSWMRTSMLRAARGDWAEAIVGYEATLEAYFHHVATALLVDHGWKRADFIANDIENNQMRNKLNIVTHHLRGNGQDLKDIHEAVWKARNRVVHKGDRATRQMCFEVHDKSSAAMSWIQDRLSTSIEGRRHPLTAWLVHAEAASLPKEAIRVIRLFANHAPDGDLSKVNDASKRTVVHCDPSSSLKCWPKGRKIPAVDELYSSDLIS